MTDEMMTIEEFEGIWYEMSEDRFSTFRDCILIDGLRFGGSSMAESVKHIQYIERCRAIDADHKKGLSMRDAVRVGYVLIAVAVASIWIANNTDYVAAVFTGLNSFIGLDTLIQP